MSGMVKEKKNGLTKTVVAVAALALVVGSIAWGTSNYQVFAQSKATQTKIQNVIPKVTTVKEIKTTDNLMDINMAIPEVKGLKDEKLQKTLNDKIYQKAMNDMTQAQKKTAEDKEAWLKTGGDEKDYMKQGFDLNYDVKALTNSILSLEVETMQTQASAYSNLDFYNYDLKTGKEITLKDALTKALGTDYIKKANDQIKEEIAKRSKVEGNFFFDGSEGVDGFKTITDDQSFYMNKDGNPVIVFNKYEIAPGYMGVQEFEIK